MAYAQADIVVFCFSFISLSCVRTKWLQETQRYAPYFLVGTDTALRQLCNTDHVPSTMGEKMTKEIKASGYIEVSSTAHWGVGETFEHAILAVLAHKRNK
eukprot:Phypoly_transcript_22537.p2 GENE.Phypoly_transcript_22537~~Phypoly_transcript_22537.p2  ORF type:complete len:100 (+),score=6.88 Phypoly_transcript_22537:239-538(+)